MGILRYRFLMVVLRYKFYESILTFLLFLNISATLFPIDYQSSTLSQGLDWESFEAGFGDCDFGSLLVVPKG